MHLTLVQIGERSLVARMLITLSYFLECFLIVNFPEPSIIGHPGKCATQITLGTLYKNHLSKRIIEPPLGVIPEQGASPI